MDLDAEQLRAVDLCVDASKRLVSVTGEAGTGKTTIIKQTCDRLAALHKNVHHRCSYR